MWNSLGSTWKSRSDSGEHCKGAPHSGEHWKGAPPFVSRQCFPNIMQSCFLGFEFCLLKTHKKATRRLRRSTRRYDQLTTTTSNLTDSSQASLPTERKLRGRGGKIVVGRVVKAKISELEEEVRVGCSRSTRKEFTGVVQGISGKKGFLVRFQDRCENNLSSNQIAIVIVEKSLKEKEPEVFTNTDIPEEQV